LVKSAVKTTLWHGHGETDKKEQNRPKLFLSRTLDACARWCKRRNWR